jgi:mannose-6-phosphate isomerase-like protein (cupin superfamily)
VTPFATMRLPAAADTTAPDGSAVRLLARLARGSAIHVELPPGATSVAVAHHTVEEIWYVLGGRGEMWRQADGHEDIVALERDVCITIPVGTRFQFRTLGDEPLTAFAITMPPWPGADEAYRVEGTWR